jgi:anti-sigma regulatory factor (Ser/Thr protein kinase)
VSPVDVELPAVASSAAAARAAVRSYLRGAPGEVDSQALDRALLLTSEIVTNAILHARTPLRLVVCLDNGEAEVRVYDGGQALPRRRSYQPDAGTGRGMNLVEALADRWGVEATPAGKCVWFAVAVSATARPSRTAQRG